jgi:hypothetical protein
MSKVFWWYAEHPGVWNHWLVRADTKQEAWDRMREVATHKLGEASTEGAMMHVILYKSATYREHCDWEQLQILKEKPRMTLEEAKAWAEEQRRQYRECRLEPWKLARLLEDGFKFSDEDTRIREKKLEAKGGTEV